MESIKPFLGRFGWPLHRHPREQDLLPKPPEGQLALITALDSVSASISSARTIHEMLTIIVDAAKRFTGTEKVIVCLVEEDTEHLALDETTLVVRGARSAHLQDWWGRHLAEIADNVFADGRPYFDVDHDREAWLLAVPVRVQDQPLGVLVAINNVTHRLLPEHTAFLSILGAVAAVSIANARLAEDSRYAMLASERERIAREMHDGISQSLFSISLGMELCKKQLTKDPPRAARMLDDLQAQLRTSAAELRRLVYDLRPVKLRDMGLVDSIETWVREATQGSEMRGSVEVEGQMTGIGPAGESCIYRVAKEAVSNAVRHSGGASVVVRLCFRPDSVLLVVEDDGGVLAAAESAGRRDGLGWGLGTMR
ncbi:GAF domain-containing protein, partial [bacterium]|nr:GAF domain-containing protein [bacterium]